MQKTEHTYLIVVMAAGILILLAACILLSLRLFQSMADNATLQYQNACITAESAQEKTFAEIYSDLTKIIKELRQINRRLDNQALSSENAHLKH